MVGDCPPEKVDANAANKRRYIGANRRSVRFRPLYRIQPAQMRRNQYCRFVRKLMVRSAAFLGFLHKQSVVLIVDLLHIVPVVGVELIGGNSLELREPGRELGVESGGKRHP
jgi:hypothetical protein